MEDYKDIQDLLKPRRDIKASAQLRNRVKTSVDRKRRATTLRRNWILGGISAGIAAAVLLLVLIPSGASAISPKEILNATFNTLTGVDFFDMEVEVRTLPNDNFSYINPGCDFVNHKISVARIDSAICWRVDKSSRQAMHNGHATYMWIDAIKSGWFSRNPDWNVLGYLSVFLNPTATIETELYQCINDPTADYDIKKDNDNIYLTIHSLPKGDFSNPYMLNTSIAESECYRRYMIDAKTNKLISATVSVVVDGCEVEMIRLRNITYGSTDTDITRLPSDIEFINVDIPAESRGLSGINATEAASLILNAFSNWNTDILGKAIDPSLLQPYKAVYAGAELIDIGKAFRSGNDENETFIPYILKLSNGQIKRYNLALYRTPGNGWIVIGGL